MPDTAPSDNANSSLSDEGLNQQRGSVVDESELRKIFRMIDTDESGMVDSVELSDAMRMLGVKCTANSARKVLAELDKDKSGAVDWKEFNDFFAKVRNPEELKALLASENHKFLDYKLMVEEDPTFGKRFIVPDTIASLKKYEVHNDNVEDVCWLSDEHFVSCSLDKVIAVWNANDAAKYPRPVEMLEGHAEGIYCLRSDGQGNLISGAASAELFLWDMSPLSGEGPRVPKVKFNGHSSPIYSVSVSPDGRNAISGNKAGTCLYHDISREDPIVVMDHHKNVAQSVDFSPDGSLICSASNDGTIQIFDIRASKKARCVSKIDDAAATGVVFCCQWRPGNEHEVLSSGDDYCVKRWDLRKVNVNSGPITNFFGHTSNVRTLCMSPCGQFLVSAAEDGCIRLWVIDEMLHVIEEQDNVAEQLEELDKKREDLEKRLESAGRAIHEPLRNCVKEMHSLYDRFEELKDMKDERDAMHCLQARMGFTGHALNVSGVAWRQVGDQVQLVSSSWDQTVQLFKLGTPKTNDFVQWAK